MSIFTQIIERKIKADIVYENERILVIKDIAPKAPVHLLLIPKKHISSFQQIKEEDLPIMGELILLIQKLAIEFDIEDGYRVVVNNGKEAGQTIFHLHLHLLGGKKMTHNL